MIHEPLLLRAHARRRRSAARMAGVILLAIVVGLLVGSDVRFGVHDPARTRRAEARLPIPPRAEIATLLTNTPLTIAPADALALNAARPLDRLQVSPARPFVLPLATAAREANPTAALDCLTKAVYYEAAVESETGQRAVAQVVLNRMRSPIFPHTVCGVVFQGSQLPTGCQFSFTCDGSLLRQPSLAGWLRARRVALAALAGHVESSVGLATHYHANYVVPYWASSLDKISTIGAHIFYTMRGSLGRPGAFGAHYDALAEAPPVLTPATDPAVESAITAAGTAASLVPAKPRNRTDVREDALGTALPPAPNLAAAVTILKADERRGELAADANRGALNR